MYMYAVLTNSITRAHTQAGVVEDMNELASRFMSETDSRDDVVAEAAKVAEEHEDSRYM